MNPDSLHDALAALLVWKRGLNPADRDAIDSEVGSLLQAARGDARTAIESLLRESTPIGSDSPTMTASPPSLEGHILIESLDSLDSSSDRYTISRLHSQGGLGQVWLARDRTFGREVAFKAIRPERSGHPDVLNRFLREARVTGNLEHPGIVPVYELSKHSDSGQPFYTMRFVRGRTLTEAIRNFHQRRARGEAGPLELQGLLEAFVRIVDTIAYAHSRGVIHRDLKGDNVILGDFGETIVLDWGLAKRIGEAESASVDDTLSASTEASGTIVGQLLGTPAYMAPEQARGDLAAIGPLTDIYGLGAILYEILSGQPPFSAPDVQEVIRQVREVEPQRPRQLVPTTAPALEAICLKAISKQPQARYASAPAMAEDLRRFLADEPVEAWPEPITKRIARWSRRHRGLVIGGGALLVTVLVALAIGNVLLNLKQKEIERQRAQAEANYRMAKQAVDRYLTTIAQSRELKTKGLEALRRDLFGTARTFYEKFAQERAGDPGALEDLGSANLNLGTIRRETGETDIAEAAYLESIAIYEKLVKAEPNDPRHRQDLLGSTGDLALLYSETSREERAEAVFKRAFDLNDSVAGGGESPDWLSRLANAYDNYGTMLSRRRQVEAAEKATKRGLELRERIAVLEHRDEDSRKDLLISYINLSNLYGTTGRESLAIAPLLSAAEIGEGLVQAHPGDPTLATGLAATYNNLGGIYTLTGKIDEALVAHRKALAIRRTLSTEHPEMIEYQLYLAGSVINIGELSVRTKQYEAALESLNEGLTALERILQREPRHAFGRFYSAYALSWEARALDLLGRLPQAEATWKRSESFNDNGFPTIPAGYALFLARHGQSAAALTRVERISSLKGLPGEVLYDLAATRSVIAARSAPESAQRRSQLEAALTLLQAAEKLGFFGTPGNKALAASDPDFAALRDDPRFKQLIAP